MDLSLVFRKVSLNYIRCIVILNLRYFGRGLDESLNFKYISPSCNGTNFREPTADSQGVE